MKSKNDKLIQEFTKYCKMNPEMRFWQALRNWAEVNRVIIEKKDKEGELVDTFYFEGRRK
jgi:hypothetical protein